MYFSKRALGCSPSATVQLSAAAKRLKAEGKDVISFGIGEPNFPTVTAAKEAGIRAIAEDRNQYTPSLGETWLREAICAKLKRDQGLEYTPDQVGAGSGAKSVLYQLFLALLEPGDEVLIFAPYWVSYPEQVKMVGGTPVFVASDPLTFAVDFADLQAKISAQTKLMVINSPHNPTGAVYDREMLEALLKIARERDLTVISDEVYEPFCYGQPFVSPATFSADAFSRTIVVNAASKTYSMTGYRLGYFATASRELVQQVSKLQDNNQGNPGTISQHMAAAALTGAQEEVAAMKAAFESRRDLMMGYFKKMSQLTCAEPPGAFYCFPRLRDGLSSAEVAQRLLMEALVAVVPGEAFGAPGYLRFSYALEEKQLKEGMARVVKWFAANSQAGT